MFIQFLFTLKIILLFLQSFELNIRPVFIPFKAPKGITSNMEARQPKKVITSMPNLVGQTGNMQLNAISQPQGQYLWPYFHGQFYLAV